MFKKYLVITILLILLTPLVITVSNIRLPGLAGAFEETPAVSLSLSTFLNKEFQDSFESRYKDSSNVHKVFLRVHNQINLSLFNYTNTSVRFGKDGYLFMESVIENYIGNNSISVERIHDEVYNLSLISEKLDQLGVNFVLFIVPSKAFAHEEYLPDGLTNNHIYPEFSKYLSELSVPTVDTLKLYLEKPEVEFQNSFPKCGHHWNDLGMLTSLSELVNYMQSKSEEELANFSFSIDNAKYSHIKFDEDDIGIGSLLNVLIPPDCGENLVLKADPIEGYKPKVLFINDSFYGKVRRSGVRDLLFDAKENWYYNRTAVRDLKRTPLEYTLEEKKQIFLEKDFVVLLINVDNIHRIDTMFTNDACEMFSIECRK